MSENQRICEIVEYDNVKYTIIEIGEVIKSEESHQEDTENENPEIIDLESDFEDEIASSYIAKAQKMVQRRKPVNFLVENVDSEEINVSNYVSTELGETSTGSHKSAIKKNLKRLQPVPEKRLVCFKCGEIFSAVWQLNSHRYKGCVSDEEVPCEICCRMFSKNYLCFHRLTHSKERNIECGICRRKFKYESSRRAHLEKKHNVVCVD